MHGERVQRVVAHAPVGNGVVVLVNRLPTRGSCTPRFDHFAPLSAKRHQSVAIGSSAFVAVICVVHLRLPDVIVWEL